MPTDDTSKKPNPDRAMLSVTEIAERSGLTISRVEALVRAGAFGRPAQTPEEGPLVPASAVEHWMTAHTVRWPLTQEDKARLEEFTPAEFFDGPELTLREKTILKKKIKEGRALSIAARQQMLTERRRRLIYFDLDGVLADFRKAFIAATGEVPERFSKDEMWAHVASVPQFFSRLEVTVDAKHLLPLAQTLGEVHVLTAIPRKSTYPDAEDEKRQWTAIHFGSIAVNVVQYARQKADFARPGDVLIDDSPDTIRRWIKRGGFGIVHTDLDSTVAALVDYRRSIGPID